MARSPGLLTYAEAVELLRAEGPGVAKAISTHTLKTWCQRGWLQRARFGRGMVVLRSEVEEIIRGERGPWQSGSLNPSGSDTFPAFPTSPSIPPAPARTTGPGCAEAPPTGASKRRGQRWETRRAKQLLGAIGATGAPPSPSPTGSGATGTGAPTVLPFGRSGPGRSRS